VRDHQFVRESCPGREEGALAADRFGHGAGGADPDRKPPAAPRWPSAIGGVQFHARRRMMETAVVIRMLTKTLWADVPPELRVDEAFLRGRRGADGDDGDLWVKRQLARLKDPPCPVALVWPGSHRETGGLRYHPCSTHPAPGEEFCSRHGGKTRLELGLSLQPSHEAQQLRWRRRIAVVKARIDYLSQGIAWRQEESASLAAEAKRLQRRLDASMAESAGRSLETPIVSEEQPEEIDREMEALARPDRTRKESPR